MNYIKHLTGFFEKVVTDNDLNPTHISLYIALFQYWNINRFQNPICISRDETMRISKVASTATYHRCMKKLHQNGYINYEPSYNPFKGSTIHLHDLTPNHKLVQKIIRSKHTNNLNKKQTATKQALNKQQTTTDTSTKQALIPYINNTNITNNINDTNWVEQQKNKNQTTLLKNNPDKKKKENPTLDQVQQFFTQQNYIPIEAEKFYNHFQSNGWLVGGRTQMKDWQAAARNWILNANKFNGTKNNTQHLHTTTTKNYAEPL